MSRQLIKLRMGWELGGFRGSRQLSDGLRRAFGLSSFDLDVCVMALAPEIDLRYQRLYAYLQDDVTRKYPSVDLALNLLCRSQDDKLARRAHFTPDAVLVRHGLLQVGLDTARPPAPLLSQAFQLDAQIVNLLLDGRGLDAARHHYRQHLPGFRKPA